MSTKKKFDLTVVEQLASKGLTQSQIAEYFGVTPALITKHKKFPEFAEALSKGKSKGIAEVAQSLFEKATSGDTAAAIFFLRSRAGWVDQNIKAKITQQISAITLSPEEIKMINKQLEDEF